MRLCAREMADRTPLAQLSAYRSESLSANLSPASEVSVDKATPLSDNTAGTPASFPSGIDPDDAYSSSDEESDSDDGAALDEEDRAIVDAAVARVAATADSLTAAEAHPPDVGASAANAAVRTQIRAARHSRPAEREGAVSQAEVAATRAELEEAKLASLFEGLGCGDDAPGIGD